MAKLGEHDLKPYPECKTTTSRWLRDVPSHWGVQSLRTLIKPRAERNCPDLPLLSVAREKGVFVRSLTDLDENHNVIPEDLSNYKVARRGNLVINKMKAWQGSMGIAPCDGIVSPAYFVFDLSISNALFAQAMFRSKPYVAHFAQASDGVRIGQWDLSIPGMREIPVLVPPSDEQAAIVRFLDHANGKIERAIRAKRKLIALLNEQKQAIIHRAVTRGLDPNVNLKPSGNPWLGDVPEHWVVRRAKYVFREVDERSRTGEEELLSVSHITGVTPRSEKNITMFKAASYVGYKMCRPDDLVINTMWAWMAALGSSNRYGIVSSAYGVYRPLRQRVIFGRYIEALLHTPHYMADILFRSTGIRASRLRLYPEEFLKIPLTLPPFDEQVAMFQWADGETKHLSSAIARAEREIELLREYRTTLTAEVVTGKLDVREAAMRLPAAAAELLPADDLPEDDGEAETIDE